MSSMKTIKGLIFAGLFGLTGMLAGCGGGGAGGTTTTTITTAQSAAILLLATSSASVQSDNSDSATITVTVLDASRSPISGTAITFDGGDGQLGVSSGPSSATGVVTISFSSGGTNRANRTVNIKASTASGITAQIPIQIIGSTLALTPSTNTATVGGAAVTLNTTVRDASSNGIGAQDLRYSIPAGNGTLTGGIGTAISQTVTSQANGAVPTITFVPAIAGNVVVTVEWLDAAGSVLQSANATIAVSAPGIPLAVTTLLENPAPITLSSTQPITVSVPVLISGVPVAKVRFSSTLGTWSNNAKVSELFATNPANEIFSAGASSGTSNIQIDALDASGNILATLNRVFQLSASPASAGDITLQAAVSNIAPSSAGDNPSTTLTATVRTSAGGNVVGGAPVLFEIMNPTGSGEQITPVISNTDSNGRAIATFFSGSQPTVGGLKIKASVLGTVANCDNSVNPAIAGICDVKTINVNTLAVGVSLGTATRVASVNNDTNYDLPMSVLVVDSSGAAVSGAVVSLSAFPVNYLKGTRNATTCVPIYAGPEIDNEDINENDNLDPGEDLNLDGIITPPHATAGSVPATKITDVNGVAEFSLIYQKEYASWVRARIRAKVVIGAGTTESTNELRFILPFSTADASPTCSLPNSPASW
jgi:hypothetical protein